jgi:hypothetical protein
VDFAQDAVQCRLVDSGADQQGLAILARCHFKAIKPAGPPVVKFAFNADVIDMAIFH